MSRVPQPYRCDQCGKLRENDVNRWWMLFARYPVSPESGDVHWFRMEPWTARRAKVHSAVHACGEDCALKLVQRWLQAFSFAPPSARPISAGSAPSAVKSDPSTGKEETHG